MESWVPITLCDIRYCCQAPGPGLASQQVRRRSVLNILYQNPVNKVFTLTSILFKVFYLLLLNIKLL